MYHNTGYQYTSLTTMGRIPWLLGELALIQLQCISYVSKCYASQSLNINLTAWVFISEYNDHGRQHG